jgi:hypothetical protein
MAGIEKEQGVSILFVTLRFQEFNMSFLISEQNLPVLQKIFRIIWFSSMTINPMFSFQIWMHGLVKLSHLLRSSCQQEVLPKQCSITLEQ